MKMRRFSASEMLCVLPLGLLMISPLVACSAELKKGACCANGKHELSPSSAGDACCAKEQAGTIKSPAQSPIQAPFSMAQSSARTRVRWQLPKHWEQLPSGEMRLGDFRVYGDDGARAEITIIPLPGTGGADVDNVNRWRGLVGLAPITADQLSANSEPVEIANQSARLFEMAGLSGDDEKTRILVAILRRNGTSWFFKAIGSDALVAREKAAFKEFLKRLVFEEGAKPPRPNAESTAKAW